MLLLVFVVFVVLTVYALIDIATSDPRAVRSLPRGVWALLVALAGGPAAVVWLVAGRPLGAPRPDLRARAGGLRRGRSRPTPSRPAAVGPDDDPDFLRSLGGGGR